MFSNNSPTLEPRRYIFLKDFYTLCFQKYTLISMGKIFYVTLFSHNQIKLALHSLEIQVLILIWYVTMKPEKYILGKAPRKMLMLTARILIYYQIMIFCFVFEIYSDTKFYISSSWAFTFWKNNRLCLWGKFVSHSFFYEWSKKYN